MKFRGLGLVQAASKEHDRSFVADPWLCASHTQMLQQETIVGMRPPGPRNRAQHIWSENLPVWGRVRPQ